MVAPEEVTEEQEKKTDNPSDDFSVVFGDIDVVPDWCNWGIVLRMVIGIAACLIIKDILSGPLGELMFLQRAAVRMIKLLPDVCYIIAAVYLGTFTMSLMWNIVSLMWSIVEWLIDLSRVVMDRLKEETKC